MNTTVHRPPRLRFLQAASVAMLLSAPAAVGQVCTTEGPDRERVDVDHAMSATGKFVRLRNSSAGYPQASSTFNFKWDINGQDILMADPTIIEIDGTYYITGTTDGWSLPNDDDCTELNYDPAHSNFAIYKTTDFSTFTFHAWAFDSTYWEPHQRIREIGGRNFARLQSPQLFRKPSEPGVVYMIFHATEEALVPEPNPDGSINWAAWQNASVWPSDPWDRTSIPNPNALVNTLWPDRDAPAQYFNARLSSAQKHAIPAFWSPAACDHQSSDPGVQAAIQKFNDMTVLTDAFGSVFIVSVPTSAFKAAAGAVAFPNADPSWFGYKHDNQSGNPMKYDGGAAQGREIPCSGSAAIANPNTCLSVCPGNVCHQLFTCGWAGMSYGCWGNMPWMFNDGFVFFDPNDPNNPDQAYLYYGWFEGGCSNAPEWNGNHIAYHKLLDTPGMYQLDAAFRTQAMAFDRNTTPANLITDPCTGTPQPNGTIADAGCPIDLGTAEGAAIFYWSVQDEGPGKYFAVYTRNHWNSPAYQIVYRTADTLAGLGLGQDVYYNPGITEHVLLASDSPVWPYGHSYGHVDVFWVDWPRSSGSGTARHPYLTFHAKEAGSNERHVFFKELRWNSSTGRLERMYQSGGVGRPAHSDVTRFILPRCGS